MSQLLITVFVGVLVYLWHSRFKHVASWWRRTPSLRDRGFDLAELDMPAGWRPGHDLNDSAGIEAVDLLHGRYAVVISESREDFDARLDLETYALGARDSLTSDVRVLNIRGPERRVVDGFDAVQYEIEGVHEMTRVRYLFTVVMGRRAFHQIVAWSPRSAFNRKVFDELLTGFRERPGPAPHSFRSQRPASGSRVIGFRPGSPKPATPAPVDGQTDAVQVTSHPDQD